MRYEREVFGVWFTVETQKAVGAVPAHCRWQATTSMAPSGELTVTGETEFQAVRRLLDGIAEYRALAGKYFPGVES